MEESNNPISFIVYILVMPLLLVAAFLAMIVYFLWVLKEIIVGLVWPWLKRKIR